MTGLAEKPPHSRNLTPLERHLLNDYQRDFPLGSRPYQEIAQEQGVDESEVIETFSELDRQGMIGRIGAVVRPHRAGWSTLAAMAVPEPRLDAVADLINSYPQVNHNYEREHHLNLWFVVTGESQDHVWVLLDEIRRRTGLEVLDLPLEEAFCLDLGFPIQW